MVKWERSCRTNLNILETISEVKIHSSSFVRWIIHSNKTTFFIFYGCFILMHIQCVILITGSESERQTSLQPGNRAAVHALSSPREIQKAALLLDILPLSIVGKAKVPHAWLEYSVRFQRL